MLNSLHAASQDGTSTLVYKSNLQIFQNGMDQFVRGFVRLDNGIAIGPRASAFMDTNISVSGPLDLGETGTLVLLNSLYTDGPITLTSGGNIKGKATVSGDAKTIFLGGDMTLSATTYARVLHITGDWSNSGTSGDLIIDGQGHTLTIGDRAQIFVDSNVTLTLRNMTIMTGAKSLMVPPIRLASNGSKLTLDNVMFDLGADFQFTQGQIFIHNEVAVTGTSAFVYRSPNPSYITSGATWFFDPGTTFSVAPATFTDCPPMVTNTYINNNFIVLLDQSSTLYLNSCTLKTTYTGLRLTEGAVALDNRVAIDTMAGVDLASTGTTPLALVSSVSVGSGLFSVEFTPDGRFFAAGVVNDSLVKIYKFSPTGGQVQVGGSISVTAPRWVEISPDGRFFAVGTATSPGLLRIYRLTGNSTPRLVTQVTGLGNLIIRATWSPDGRFVAIINNSAPSYLQVYRFDGVAQLTQVGTAINLGSIGAFDLEFSPDGRFLVASSLSNSVVQMFRFRSNDTPLYVGGTVGTGANPACLAWSPDGRFFAVTNYGASTIQVFRAYGNAAPTLVGAAVATGGTAHSVAWSPNGRYFVVACETSSSLLRVFKFDGVSQPVALPGDLTLVSAAARVTWSPDGNYVLAGSKGNNTVQVYRCNFVSTPAAQQSFSNSLIFGQSALGSSYNVDVNVAGSARVEVNGKVSDDSA